MDSERSKDITRLLNAARGGDQAAFDHLRPLVVEELSEIADGLLAEERSGAAIGATSLIHLAYARLLHTGLDVSVADRRRFYLLLARIMRQILVDHAQAKRLGKTRHEEPLDALLQFFKDQSVDLLAFHHELDRIHELNPRWGDVVTLRVFGGMSAHDVAAELDISERIVLDDSRFTAALLHQRLIGRSGFHA
ncbi:MAG: hypothetical protein HYX68_29675 [Planctomycetes bacterium]|nr:hypothetical protein [Planctomycetota bacterium]